MLPLALTALLALPLPESDPVRVACLGDSLTFGARVVDRERNAYPAQLAHRLPAHEVRNFGVGGRTLARAADAPYVATDAWSEALAWKPDVAVIILGTNDTVMGRRGNWSHEGDLEVDARAMAEAVLEVNPRARVLLCSPPPMFPDQPGLEEARRADLTERSPRLERVGRALREVASGMNGVDYHDLSRVLRAGQTVDGVHTTPFGAEAIAERVAGAILARPAPSGVREALESRSIPFEAGEWHGYPRYDFTLPGEDGSGCILVAPHAARVGAEGQPWIWRARFFGHQPDLDLDLLERGFHLAYCDVSNLFGSPRAVDRWERFQDLCESLGLGPRPALEGMSRGGLIALNYAIAHPGRVGALYLDNAVCDFRSWPGGRTGKRSDADWERCREAYGLTEEEAWAHEGGPLSSLDTLAKADLPIFSVVGTDDLVVPVAENGAVLESAYREAGGRIEVWEKPGSGHHPHGLHPPAPLRRRLLDVLGLVAPPTVRAVPSAEYRGHPAGWGGGTWWGQVEKMRAVATENPSLPVVFLGDSITQGLTGSADRLARDGGTRAFDRYLGGVGAMSLGLSGDRTEHLLFRIDHGALGVLDPSLIVLQIGVNNVNAARHTGEETGAGVLAVIERLLEREPQARILVCGPFPAGRAGDARRAEIDRTHELISALSHEDRATYLDLRGLFLDEKGEPNERMSGDALHINERGREAWLEALVPLLDELEVR